MAEHSSVQIYIFSCKYRIVELSPYTGKYASEKAHVLTYFMQCKEVSTVYIWTVKSSS